MNKYKSKILIIDSSENDLIIDNLTLLLCSDRECVGHEIVDQTRVSTGIAMDSAKSSITDDVNVLELEKHGASAHYKYVFDAKYRIEMNPEENAFYPDDRPGPKVDDINTMHRYRDAIVYENANSRFTFEKTMFGAYILFPYGDEKEYSCADHKDKDGEVIRGYRFYRSIDCVNIGGLPFLPSATSLVTKLLDELVNDSPDTA